MIDERAYDGGCSDGRAMSEEYENYLEQSSASNRKILGVVVAGVIIAAAIVFLLQNTEETTVKFLFFSFDTPVYIVILISMVLGALLTQIAFWLRRRAKRRKHDDD
jgi:uncharacterized integral membrane protein